LPRYLAGVAVERGLLVSVLDDFLPEEMPWHAVYPSARHLSPKVRALVELLEQRFAARGT
jgi:DNA-binding transcriptional LysR family regulator